jgi:hypothetical protein
VDDAAEVARRLEQVRAMYFMSVEQSDWVGTVRDSLRALEPRILPDSEAEIAFQAYRGAVDVVRAKHSRWPPNKLKFLNEGARILDDLVARHPDNLEVRYLRLASYLFLPFFLRRDDSVNADLGVLSLELPDHPEAFAPGIYQGVLRFVLETGRVEGEARARLEEAAEGERRGQPEHNDRKTING